MIFCVGREAIVPNESRVIALANIQEWIITPDLVARVGIKTRTENDPYFMNHQRLFSFQMSIVFLETINGSDLDFGIQ
jgi:hypothetical protein